MPRRVDPELMDAPAVPSAQLAQVMGALRTLNRRLGGVQALLGHLEPWSRRWPRDRQITLLDLGTGSADLPVAARAWAREHGLDLRITALDFNPRVLDIARGVVAGSDGITLVEGDARRPMDLFSPGSFDYVHAGLFLHHLEDEAAGAVLLAMDRLARAGIIWNDLMRTRRGYLATWVFTLATRPIVRHDALVSLRAGFTEEEVRGYRERLGLSYTDYRENFHAQRFTLAGEKPGAWDGGAPACDTVVPGRASPAPSGRS